MIKTVGSEKYLMPIADQVCSYEHAVRLRELGFPQNTYYYYMKYNGSVAPSLVCGNRFPEDEWTKHYGAYTVAEMGLILPDWYYSLRLDGNRGWICENDDRVGELDCEYIEDCTSEVEVRAKMLIFLREAKKI